jgi:hypothetical protein
VGQLSGVPLLTPFATAPAPSECELAFDSRRTSARDSRFPCCDPALSVVCVASRTGDFRHGDVIAVRFSASRECRQTAYFQVKGIVKVPPVEIGSESQQSGVRPGAL